MQKFGIPWNPCDKDFRILDLLKPLRQRFQNFGPTGTLASKISEFWTYWNPCVKDFRILNLLEPLQQRFQNFGPVQTLATKISEFWTEWQFETQFELPDPAEHNVSCSALAAEEQEF